MERGGKSAVWLIIDNVIKSLLVFQVLPISGYFFEEASLVCGPQAFGSEGIGCHSITVDLLSCLAFFESASSEVPILLLGVLIILQFSVELSHALSDGHIFQSI